jgi:hypothetical protein
MPQKKKNYASDKKHVFIKKKYMNKERDFSLLKIIISFSIQIIIIFMNIFNFHQLLFYKLYCS